MADKKSKLPIIVSPKGRFKHPHLTIPDTKFDKEGRLHVDLVMAEEDAGPFVKKMVPIHATAVKRGEEAFSELSDDAKKKFAKKGITGPVVNDLFTEEVDEKDEPTGNTIFRFGTKATGVSRKRGEERQFQRRITLFDAKGNPIRDAAIQVWSGTIGKISFVAVPYFIPGTAACGVSLRLVAAQILELVSGGRGKSAEQFGFGREEQGYEFTPGDEAPDKSEDEGGEIEEMDF